MNKLREIETILLIVFVDSYFLMTRTTMKEGTNLISHNICHRDIVSIILIVLYIDYCI